MSVTDVQQTVDEALGTASAANDVNGDQVVNVVAVQIVISAALGLGLLKYGSIFQATF